jgi:hypothetical protein
LPLVCVAFFTEYRYMYMCRDHNRDQGVVRGTAGGPSKPRVVDGGVTATGGGRVHLLSSLGTFVIGYVS